MGGLIHVLLVTAVAMIVCNGAPGRTDRLYVLGIHNVRQQEKAK
jgi:hypothetical protein